MEQWLRDHEHGIKAVVAVAAAVFALVQYFNHLREARVQQTLEFYSRFSSEPLYSSRIDVLKSWEAMWLEIQKIPSPSTKEEVQEQRAHWKQFVVATVTKDAQLTAQINAMFDFFGALQVCIENNICDKKSARELLRGAAKEFFENNCPYVAYMRYDRKSTEFGVKTAALVDNSCKVEIFNQPLPNTSLHKPAGQ